jgi:hypothetical protein
MGADLGNAVVQKNSEGRAYLSKTGLSKVGRELGKNWGELGRKKMLATYRH